MHSRSVEEMLKTSEIVKGEEALRLRQYLSNEYMDPMRDLDDYGRLLMDGNLPLIKKAYETHVQLKVNSGLSLDEAKAQVAIDQAQKRYGPTGIPIYNALGNFILLFPSKRQLYLQIAKWYIEDVKMPVTALDYSGCTTMRHAFSTKPMMDLEWAEMLYNAGGCDVNDRSRYGAIVAHEIVMIFDRSDKEIVQKAYQALKWFLEHGGNLDIADSDGVTARFLLQRMAASLPSLNKLVEQEDRRRAKIKDRSCATCGREESEELKLLRCGKCKEAKYCPPTLRACQRLDWPHHKKACKAPKS
jgi:MYND finger